MLAYFWNLGLLYAQTLPFSFDAKGLVVLSDADMVASAYVDGQLKTEVLLENTGFTLSVRRGSHYVKLIK